MLTAQCTLLRRAHCSGVLTGAQTAMLGSAVLNNQRNENNIRLLMNFKLLNTYVYLWKMLQINKSRFFDYLI